MPGTSSVSSFDATISSSKNNGKVNDVNVKDNIKDENFVFVQALQVIQSGGLPMVLKAVCELDVFAIMAKAGAGNNHMSAKDIAAQLSISLNKPGINPDHNMLDRMLRLLATNSIVSCSVVRSSIEDGEEVVERRYKLTPLSQLFVPAGENGISLTPFLALVEDQVVRAHWSHLKDAVLEGGIPFKMAHGVAGFDYPKQDPRFNNVLNKAMFNYTTILVQKILQTYEGFGDVNLLVDVGGGLGHTLNAIITKHPSIRGINFDLPHVVCHAKPYPGIEHVGGNMFESVPQGDAIMMKGILHDWTDDHCLKLLKNCYKALPENGKVIILELLLTDEPDTSVLGKAITQFDIYLMNIGGKERTEKELLALATAAGFKSMKLHCRVGQYWVIEFLK